MKRSTTVYAVLTGLVIAAAVAGYVIRDLATFPGRIAAPAHAPSPEDGRWTFRGGVIYRHPGAVPLLEVSGAHYGIGLQYGVLLRPEILAALEAYARILHRTAEDMGLSSSSLAAGLRFRANRMARRLPKRFRDEIRGVSHDSGVPVGTIVAVSLLYDVFMTGGCTGLLLRGRDGAIIHGRSQEPSGFRYGGLLGKYTVVVRYRADGYHAVTHIDPPLFMGVETGYNDQGLTYSDETYSIREPNPNGFPIVYLARMALEEASALEGVYRVIDRQPVAAPGGTIWSDRTEGRGVRIEITPAASADQPFDGAILWNFNDIVDPQLAKQQHPRTNLAGFNRDREHIASAFPRQAEYAVEDAVAFLRSRHAADGRDYSWLGTRRSIANAWGQQMAVFDPEGDGFYLAVGESFAALREVYRYRDDFSRVPELSMDAVPLEPIVEEAARISTGLMSKADRLHAYVELARTFPDDANVHFLVAHGSFEQVRWDLFAAHADQAYALAPDVPEYRLYAGLAAYQQAKLLKVAGHLEGPGASHAGLAPEQELYRLTALERAWAARDPERAAHYEAERLALLAEHGAAAYYRAAILPRFERLENGSRTMGDSP